MDSRKLSHDEIIDIVMATSHTMEKKLQQGAVIVPKLIKAALAFYRWLAEHDKIDEEETQSRDVIAEMMKTEMKKRI